MTEIQQLLDNKLVLAGLSAVGGWLAKVLADRLSKVEYWVTHSRIGFTGNDPLMGDVRVTWQGEVAPNLWASKVILSNATHKDLESVRVKVYTGNDTSLLSERTQVLGTAFHVDYSPEYQAKIKIEPGQQATDEQKDLFHHQREYIVPVFNRGDQVELTFLTIAIPPAMGPSIWLDVLHKGVVTRYIPNEPLIDGVPVRIAKPIGMALATVLVFALWAWVDAPRRAAALGIIGGFAIPRASAAIVRLYRWGRRKAWGR